MFTKFAKLEVLEVKSAPSRVRTAALSKFADFNEYRTDDGYIYVRVRAISSRVNKNHDGWPSEELKKSYRTFIGKPIFVDHHNTDPKKARGVIVDAALHVDDRHTASLDPYYATAPENHQPPTWIELLLEVDAKKFPRLAKAIVGGDIDGVSMGANVEMSKCSHCGNEARSPEEFCKHIVSKGAYFDYYGPTGQKTSKKSYEDCYGVGFFEISFVFDPADETALVSDIKHTARLERIAAIHTEANLKTADQKPGPQSDMIKAPQKVNTLRQEQDCPICGSTMEDGVCEVCNYEEAPEGFDNPDLEKAKQVDQQIHQQDAQQAAQGLKGQPNDVMPGQQGDPDLAPAGATPAGPGVMSSSTSNYRASAAVSNENSKTSASNGGRINTQERPILPVTRQLSDKPIAPRVVQEAKKPVESNVKDKMAQTTKVADGVTPKDPGVQPEKRVDVEGVGGFMQDTDADKQVDVTGVGAVSGDPLSGIEHENVEKDTGNFQAPHTDTWSGGEGDSLGQHDPVTNDTGDLFTVSHEKEANKYIKERDGKYVIIQKGTGKVLSTHDSKEKAEESFSAMEMHKHEGAEKTADSSADLGGPIGDGVSGGSAKDGGPTWDTSDAGFPDHQPSRVDLAAPLKEEVGEGTKTWSGTDGFADPITSENANELGGPIGVAVAKAKALQLKAFKIAETEIELGLTESDDKFDRVSELESNTEAALDAHIETLARVKTAGLKKTASAPAQKTAGRMPSMRPVTAAFDIEAHSVNDINPEDSLW